MMDDKVEKPCWNITAWALTGFVLFVCIIALMSGSGPEVASTSIQPVS